MVNDEICKGTGRQAITREEKSWNIGSFQQHKTKYVILDESILAHKVRNVQTTNNGKLVGSRGQPHTLA